jgi:hypothetical protein
LKYFWKTKDSLGSREDIYIDINVILSLPTPTPFIPCVVEHHESEIISMTETITFGTNQVKGGKEFLTKGGTIEEKEYKFSKKAVENLESRR